MRRTVLLLVAVFVVGAFGTAPAFADSTRLCNNRCASDNDITTTNNIDNSVEDNSTTNIDNTIDNSVTNNTTNNTTNNIENCSPTQTGNNNTVNCFR